MKDNMTESGRIELVLGPMFSGKTTRLIELIRKSAYKSKKTIMVKFSGDKRYTKESQVVTHDQIKYDSIESNNLKDVFDVIKEYDIIGVDEGQFFSDLVEVCDELTSLGKTIVIAALNGDFRMKPFPVVANIIPKADRIKLLKAYCFNCHQDAEFSLRIVSSNETILIGAGEAYKPACRACHKYFSKIREEGNLNVEELAKSPVKKPYKENLDSNNSSTSASASSKNLEETKKIETPKVRAFKEDDLVD